ncbi:glycosyltransferase [Sinomicrobium soli]|uniref:glycosyltransferase n=1 Tax=Sinomicrobium sp. N-1-3-6 TaxID=2219864 RepID=UPI000DCD2C7F|nr:glycosyltransferase [Sinomicrobium sp. N-1-3-6]RAV30527.1 glycosyl transferase family 2 [Sinomicrobium sp. N-1-3-6]
MLTILLCLLTGSTGILIGYYLLSGKLAYSGKGNLPDKTIPVSVIIRTKNNAGILRQTLPHILSQKHPDFQVVIINDASSDNTSEVIAHFEASYPNIRVVHVINNEAFWGKKKYALTLGIKAARHPFMIFTEDRFVPASGYWLQEMSRHYHKNKNIVLGYASLKRVKGSFSNAIIRYDNLVKAVKYLSFAKAGLPYTGSGRNMAYHKSVFYQVNGFISHMNMSNGEDELFINEVATAENTAICITPRAHTRSVSTTGFRTWVYRKREAFLVFRNFKLRDRLLSALLYLAKVMFWLLPVPILILAGTQSRQTAVLAAILLIKWVAQYISAVKISGKLGEKDLLWLLPLYEAILIIVQFYIFITGFRTRTRWK